MGKEQLEHYEKMQSSQEKVIELFKEYWFSYSDFSTWQFWLIFLLFFVAPLVSLFFLLDRKNKFLLGFYGFNIHVWFGYIDVWGSGVGYWGYPYKLTPFLPGNLSLDAALVPVLFMLVYQWTLIKKKNFYLYSAGLALIMAFIFKPILGLHNLFLLQKGANYLHIFLLYCLIFAFSKVITNVFIKLPELKKKSSLL